MNAAVQEQAAPIAAPPKQSAVIETLGSIIDETARRQYELVLADRYAAQTYAKGAGVDEDDARTIIALGRDYGWGPAHSLQRLYMRDGKPHLYAEARASMLAQAGYRWVPVKHDDKECTYQFKYKGEWMTDVNDKPLRVTMTMAEAESAGWVKNSRGKEPNAKGNYDKIPKNMLFARMITNFHRWHAAEVDGSTMLDQTDMLTRVVDATEQQIAAKTDSAVEALKEKLSEVANAAA